MGQQIPLFLSNPISRLCFPTCYINLVMSCNAVLCFLAVSLIKHLVDTVFRSQALVIHSKCRVSSHFQTASQFPRGHVLEFGKANGTYFCSRHGFPTNTAPKTDKWTSLGSV